MCGHRSDGFLWYSVSWYTDIQDCRIRGTKSSTRIVRTGVPQGSKLSPSLFNYYIADMPRPTPPVKRVCYADDITVWATGPKIPQLESMLNNYLRDVSIYLKDNLLLISAPKSTVTLFTPDKTSSRCIQILLLKTHSYHWGAVLKYWEWFWIHPYPSTSTATMCQIGSTREIICWRHWRDHHGDRIRRLYWWHTRHCGNLSQTMQHQRKWLDL